MPLELKVVEIPAEELPATDYRWDADTEILTVTIRPSGVAEGMSGSVDIQGEDGAWLLLEVSSGRLASVEVAVWPDVRTVAKLEPPSAVAAVRLQVPATRRGAGTDALEMESAISAVADRAERTIHFRIGPQRPSKPMAISRDLLVELDTETRIAGLWFLNVPPLPGSP
jgi:hypothetical protein